MLSSISSLIPSTRAFTGKLDIYGAREQPASHMEQIDDHGGAKRLDMAEEGNKKEKKKKSTSNETFIVVRPPPAVHNHPLNLQIQLVPAQHIKDRSNTAATPTDPLPSFGFFQGGNDATPVGVRPPVSPDSEIDQGGLQRTASLHSSRSEVSAFYASGSGSGSVTSFTSTASSASGRRMIIPLYNLCAHNVRTNTVLDAGTDAKVAKFLRRGIEIMNLAVLEPTEVWDGSTNSNNATPPDTVIHRSMSRNSLAPPGQSGSLAETPDHAQHSPVSSRLSLSSGHSSNAVHPIDSATPTSMPQPAGPRKILGRLFRRKEGSTSNVSAQSAPPLTPPKLSIPEVRTPTPEPPSPLPEIILPPVLGLSSIAASPPVGRCVAHVWTVRHWLKVENQGLISGVIGKISREVSTHGYGNQEPRDWEVRFEWARGRSKGGKAHTNRRRASLEIAGRGRSHTPSRRSSTLLGVEEVAPNQDTSAVELKQQSIDAHDRRASNISASHQVPVIASATAVSVVSTAASDDEGPVGDDPGYESDPEDSETPWTCTLVLTHPHEPFTATKSHRRTYNASSTSTAPARESLRLKVATLAPALHHPKVVCQLKVPFPLPDVDVDHGVLRKRLVLPNGSTRSTVPREGSGLVMTAEEIKDVVCSTAFWVVVRRGFGGLGKKTRKGDGWNIRG